MLLTHRASETLGKYTRDTHKLTHTHTHTPSFRGPLLKGRERVRGGMRQELTEFSQFASIGYSDRDLEAWLPLRYGADHSGPVDWTAIRPTWSTRQARCQIYQPAAQSLSGSRAWQGDGPGISAVHRLHDLVDK